MFQKQLVLKKCYEEALSQEMKQRFPAKKHLMTNLLKVNNKECVWFENRSDNV